MDSFECWDKVTPGYEGCDHRDQPTPTTGRRSKSIPVCRSVILIVVSGNASISHPPTEHENKQPVSVKHLQGYILEKAIM